MRNIESYYDNIENRITAGLGQQKHWHIFDIIAKKNKKENKMSLKESNEITVKIKGKLEDLNENDEFDSIEKLINRVNQLDIPIYTDNYFVKKAEIELNKVLKR